MPKDRLRHTFFEEPPGRFALGQILLRQSLVGVDDLLDADDAAWWYCDIQDSDKLTWSNGVYDLFGLPHGSDLEREDAVGRYRIHSRGVLEHLRRYAIDHEFGFVLDAEIAPGDDISRWIRVLAVPVLEAGRVVGLRGVKRVL